MVASVWVWVCALWCACASVRVVAAPAPRPALCPLCPPAPAPTPLGAQCQQHDNAIQGECHYKIKKINNIVIEVTVTKFVLKCVKGLTLEEPALPAFPSRVSVPTVTLWGCGPPDGADGAGGYAAALARLNVSALDRLLLLQLPPAPHRPLRAAHLAGLTSLRALHISARDITKPSVIIDKTDASIFSSLTNLVKLKLEGVRVPPAALTNIPSEKLSTLELVNVGLREVPPGALCGRPLTSLLVRDRALESLPSVCNLTFLTLGPSRLRQLPPLHFIVNLTLTTDDVFELKDCKSLKSLTVTLSKAEALPDGWVAACEHLQELKLSAPRLQALPARALAGAFALTKLTLDTHYHIRQLEQGLFTDTTNLKELVLSRNGLANFSRDIFVPLSRLHSLDLSHNYLRAAALVVLAHAALPLRQLYLTDNPLGDLCSPHEPSILARLSSLELVSLQKTGSSRVCADWRREQDLPALTTLDLQDNNITQLTWEDLTWEPRKHVTEVRLSNNPLEAITVNHEQYDNLHKYKHADVKVKFILDNLDAKKPLRCDCRFYWFGRALREGVLAVRFDNLRCAAPSAATASASAHASVPFHAIDYKHMVCPMDVECPANCSCVLSPAAGGALAECAEARALPAALATLTALRPAHPAHPAQPPRLALGGPLPCACDHALMQLIREHQHQMLDLLNVKCVDDRSVVSALAECFGPEGPGLRAWMWTAGGGALTLLSASALLLALRRAGAERLRLKAFLLARGLCLRWARPPDTDPYRYDAFLSYAHEDSAVAAQLLTELEDGGLRLCVHHRDWCAGGWIPHQIAESVTASRRTIVLLSDAFVRSGWARAEFREAHARALQDGAARLLVVLLGAAPPEGLDPEMRRYVAMHTYVRWGEPAFLDKLRAALPAPRHHKPSQDPRKSRPRRRKPRAQATATPPAPPAPPPPELSATPLTLPPSPPLPTQPSTPIVKFSQIDFPTPVKPLQQATSPCA